MLAKVIAWAPSRSQAAAVLAATLAGARLHGVTTNRDMLVGVLRHPEFLAGATDTDFLVRHDPAELIGSGERVHAIHAAVAGLAAQAERRASARVQPLVPSGWRNVFDQAQRSAYSVGDDRYDVSYVVGREGGAEAQVGALTVHVLAAAAERVVLEMDGLRLEARVARYDAIDVVYVDSPLGHSGLTEVPRFPPPVNLATAGALVAPMPGTVSRVVATVGDAVTRGSVLLYLEAMKMEHPVLATGAGVVQEIRISPGDQVEAGALLVIVGE
jgi:acetyl/propionyl-CoA carboxylase alpha subunit